MATPLLSLSADSSAGQEEHPVGQPREHVVGGLVRLGVDLVAQLLDQPGALEAGAGVGDEGLEEAEVVVVEAVQLLVAIDGDDGADRGVAVGQGSDEGLVVLADDRVHAGRAVLGGRAVERRLAGGDRLGDDRCLVEHDRLDAGRPAVVEGDPAGDAGGLGQDQLGPAGPHDRADLLQDVDAHGRRFEAGRAHGPAEVVEVLQGQEAETRGGCTPVGHDDERGHQQKGQGRPRVEPRGVEEGEGEADARRHQHGLEGQQDDAGPLLRLSGRSAW